MISFLRVQFDFPNALARDSDSAVKWGHVEDFRESGRVVYTVNGSLWAKLLFCLEIGKSGGSTRCVSSEK